jgi:hypothetical protein
VAGQVRAQAEQVEQQLSLVVGRAAGEQVLATHRGLERRGHPQLQRVDRLDVVMPVDEHGRRVRLGGRPLGEDRRHAARVPHLDGGEPVPAERVGQPAGAAPDVRRVGGVGADRRDAQPRVQIGVQRAPVGPDVLPFADHAMTLDDRFPVIFVGVLAGRGRRRRVSAVGL